MIMQMLMHFLDYQVEIHRKEKSLQCVKLGLLIFCQSLLKIYSKRQGEIHFNQEFFHLFRMVGQKLVALKS